MSIISGRLSITDRRHARRDDRLSGPKSDPTTSIQRRQAKPSHHASAKKRITPSPTRREACPQSKRCNLLTNRSPFARLKINLSGPKITRECFALIDMSNPRHCCRNPYDCPLQIALPCFSLPPPKSPGTLFRPDLAQTSRTFPRLGQSLRSFQSATIACRQRALCKYSSPLTHVFVGRSASDVPQRFF